MPCAPPPPIAIAHARFVEGASPPNTLPIEPVNIACADAALSSATNTLAMTNNNRVTRKRDLPRRSYRRRGACVGRVMDCSSCYGDRLERRKLTLAAASPGRSNGRPDDCNDGYGDKKPREYLCITTLNAGVYGFPVPLWNNWTRFLADYGPRKYIFIGYGSTAAGLLRGTFTSRISGRRNALHRLADTLEERRCLS
jgi:hypothetical protein